MNKSPIRNILFCLPLLTFSLSALGAESFVIDIGSSQSDHMLGLGWNRQNEHREEVTFRWIKGLEADLDVELEPATSYAVDIYAFPFYYGNCRQTFALFVNNRYVDEWVCKHDDSWKFQGYSTVIPDDLTIAGTNRITFRMAYESHHKPAGYSLAVDRIELTPSASERIARAGDGLWLPAFFLVVVGAYLLFKKNRVKKESGG